MSSNLLFLTLTKLLLLFYIWPKLRFVILVHLAPVPRWSRPCMWSTGRWRRAGRWWRRWTWWWTPWRRPSAPTWTASTGCQTPQGTLSPQASHGEFALPWLWLNLLTLRVIYCSIISIDTVNPAGGEFFGRLRLLHLSIKITFDF